MLLFGDFFGGGAVDGRNKCEMKSRNESGKRHKPSSFLVKLSKLTPSLNLYVSQQTKTGTPRDRAIIATRAVPARENSAPFEWSAWAPSKTVVTEERIDGRAGRVMYVVGMPADVSVCRRCLASPRGSESTTMTENDVWAWCASRSAFSTTEELKKSG